MFFDEEGPCASLLTNYRAVILSERSESKDLRTDLSLHVIIVRRSLDATSFRSG